MFMGITIADIIETPSINTKLNELTSVIWNIKNGSVKINSESMDSGMSMLTNIATAIIEYGYLENTILRLFNLNS
tara:strand:- start:99 stop:323 length:225 start_codon:yes stop_codon:yes gene_type:complete